MRAVDDVYAFLRLRGKEGWSALHEALTGALPAGRLWGAFHGLFGVGSNELIAVTMGNAADAASAIDTAAGLAASQHVESLILAPTARPQTPAPRTREGLYVFRFFDVANVDVEEIAALSQAAWETFEAADAYRAEPQALFCEQDRTAERGRMLLVTWYDDLNSWQASRRAPEAARRNFQERQQLTSSTIAYATRLIA